VSPVGRSQSALTVSVGEEARAEVRRIPGRKRRSELDCVPSLTRPSGRRPNRSPGRALGNLVGRGGARCCYVVCWAEFLLESGPIRDPGFMNPKL